MKKEDEYVKKVIIIGAGIAGLSAGIYAAQSGFDTTIFESHSIPGGASTGWRRKGYYFEGGLHWLTGSGESAPLNRLWHEVGALNDDIEMHMRDPFFSFERDGQVACLYRDPNQLRRHFIELSPVDKREINQLCSDIKKFARMQMPVMDIPGVKTKYKAKMSLKMLFGMLPALSRMAYYSKMSAKELSERFQNPAIRMLIESCIGSDYSASGTLFTMATLAAGDGGYPEGGSLAMARRMAQKFESLGGKIVYQTKVDRVWTENGVARGVIIGGETIAADAVVVTLDTLVAIDTMFDAPITEPWAEKMRAQTKPMLDVFIGIGIEADLSNLPGSRTFMASEPIKIGDVDINYIGINNYAGFKGYAPEGCTTLTTALIGDSYNFWKSCRENGTYETEKKRVGDAFIRELTLHFPQIEGKVAVCDVATPLTYERYLGSYKGSWMSLMQKGQPNVTYPSKPELIQNVYFAGQRLQSPGGVPVALDSGRKAAQYICLDTDTMFQGKM